MNVSRNIAVLVAVLVSTPALAASFEVTDADRKSLHLSVYNNNLGVVTDVRELILPKGNITLAVTDIAMSVNPRTMQLKSELDSGFSAFRQSYRFDLLNRRSLLERFIGRKLKYSRFLRQDDGYEKILREGILLSIEPEIVRFGDVIEISPEGTISLPYLPDDLIAKPTLFLDGANNSRGPQALRLSYHATGFNWDADYVLTLARTGQQSDLSGWVAATNSSGSDLVADSLRLVAGDVRTVADRPAGAMPRMALQESSAAPAPAPLGDYHTYDYEGGATLLGNQTTRLELLSSTLVDVTRKYQLISAAPRYAAAEPVDIAPSITLSFANIEGNGLGSPLPAGTVRVYDRANNADGFLGEARIEHTPKGARVELQIGRAFDIRAKRTQTVFRRLGDRAVEVGWRVEIANGSDSEVQVIVDEKLSGDWEVVSESLTGSRQDAMTYRFNVPVQAQGRTEVSYTARINW